MDLKNTPLDPKTGGLRSSLFVRLQRGEEGVPVDVTLADFQAHERTKEMPAGLWGDTYKVGVNTHSIVPLVRSGFVTSPAPPMTAPLPGPGITMPPRAPRSALSAIIIPI